MFYYLIIGTSGNNLQSLRSIDEVGVLYLIFIFTLLLFTLLFKHNKTSLLINKLELKLLVGILIGFILFMVNQGLITWYALPIIVMFITLSLNKIVNSDKYKKFFIILISTYGVLSIFTYFINPFPVNENYAKSKIQSIHKDHYDLSKVLNSQEFRNEKFIITFSFSMYNITYFIDDFYNRAVYIEPDDVFQSDESFFDYVLKTDAKLFVLNDSVNINEYPCLKKKHLEYETFFRKIGEETILNKTYRIYKLK